MSGTLSKAALSISIVLLRSGILGTAIVSARFISTSAPRQGDCLPTLALLFSLMATIGGACGGVPGSTQLCFSKPSLPIDGFLPAVVFDEGNTLQTRCPKFPLQGFVKIHTPHEYDIRVKEMTRFRIAPCKWLAPKSFRMAQELRSQETRPGRPSQFSRRNDLTSS